MTRDLTVGRPEGLLWRFCLPLFGSILFQQLYNIADSLVAGKFLGEGALAAVGNSYEITLIFLAFATGCNIGCSVLVSRLFGAKRLGDMKTGVFTVMLFSVALCGAMMLIGLTLGNTFLRLIDTPENIFADSWEYLRIYVLGLPFLFFYNLSTGIFTALGDSRTPFIFLAISSTANIGLDIVFVTALPLGVAGVAWATFLCQGVSCVAAVAVVFVRFVRIRTDEPVRPFSGALFRQFLVIALPSVLQQSFVSVGNIFIQKAVNGFGSAVIAGYSASVKLNNLAVNCFFTIGNGISNYAAQNFGAGQMHRIREGCRAGVKIILSIALPVTALYLVFPRALVGFFMREPSATALSVGTLFLRIVAPFYAVIAAKLVFDGILRGTGHMTQFMVDTFTDLIIRVVFAFLLSASFGSTGIWCAWPVGWGISTALSFFFYRRGEWFRGMLPPAPTRREEGALAEAVDNALCDVDNAAEDA